MGDLEQYTPMEMKQAKEILRLNAEIERLDMALQRLITSGQKAHDIGFRKTDVWDAFGHDLKFAHALKEKGDA